MKIEQITYSIIGSDLVGKWYCSDCREGSDGDLVHRYLHHDGTWGKTAAYFDSAEQIAKALELGHVPDFSLSLQEKIDRADMRQMTDDAFREDAFRFCDL